MTAWTPDISRKSACAGCWWHTPGWLIGQERGVGGPRKAIPCAACTGSSRDRCIALSQSAVREAMPRLPLPAGAPHLHHHPLLMEGPWRLHAPDAWHPSDTLAPLPFVTLPARSPALPSSLNQGDTQSSAGTRHGQLGLTTPERLAAGGPDMHLPPALWRLHPVVCRGGRGPPRRAEPETAL